MNMFRKILKNFPLSKIEIIPDRHHDKQVAEQLSQLITYEREITRSDTVVCNDDTTFEDYSMEQHLQYLGFGISKDEQ